MSSDTQKHPSGCFVVTLGFAGLEAIEALEVGVAARLKGE